MRIVRILYHYFIPQKMPSWAAKYYDKLIDGVKDFYLRPLCEKILKKYPCPVRILDIGTGTGRLPVMLAQFLSPGPYMMPPLFICIRKPQHVFLWSLLHNTRSRFSPNLKAPALAHIIKSLLSGKSQGSPLHTICLLTIFNN